jgi:hypothetical protein
MYYMSRQIGIAVGISISSSLLKQQFEGKLRRMLVDVPGYKEVSPMRHLSKREHCLTSPGNRSLKEF